MIQLDILLNFLIDILANALKETNINSQLLKKLSIKYKTWHIFAFSV